jgi:hypothetical protein
MTNQLIQAIKDDAGLLLIVAIGVIIAFFSIHSANETATLATKADSNWSFNSQADKIDNYKQQWKKD